MTKKARIKYVVNCRFATQDTTGVQRYALECSRILKNSFMNDIVFVAPKGHINPFIKDELCIKQFGFFKGYFWEQISLPLYSFMNSSILMCFCGTPPIFYKKTIYTIHDLSFVRYPEFFNLYYQFFYKFFVRLAFERFLGISAVSQFTKNELIDFYGRREIFVVCNTVNHLIGIKESAELPLPLKNENYFLTVGSIDPRKNIEQLIKIFLKENVNAKLVIVGQKNRVFTELKDLSKLRSSNIIFTGYLTDNQLVAYYRNAECFIYPSLYEGFGIPPLEALYFDTPVLLSDIPAHREIYGNYAHYFPLSGITNIEKNAEIAVSKKKSAKIHGKKHPLIIKYSPANQKKQLLKMALNFDR